MKLTKLMKAVIAEEPETTKWRTVHKMAALGIVEILDSWTVRGGMPGASASGVKPGQEVRIFRVLKTTAELQIF